MHITAGGRRVDDFYTWTISLQFFGGRTENDFVTLPTEILEAASSPAGGRLTLVVGAGCSAANPTDLPLGRACALEAHRRLVQDNVLEPGECPHPEDLSILAQTVFEKLGSQRELVRRLPTQRFQNAQSNTGYLNVVALLMEGIILDVISLNFDHALAHSVAELGSGDSVTIAVRKRPLNDLGNHNVVYLHGDAYSDPEDWVLRVEQLEEAWVDQWEQVVVTRAMTSPVVVFAGLGSPAAVLTETLAKIRGAMANSRAFLIGRSEFARSKFAAACGVQESDYVQMDWLQFTDEVGGRVVQEQVARVYQAYGIFWEETSSDAPIERLREQLETKSLVELGLIRGKWLLSASYEPSTDATRDLVAHLLVAINVAIGATGVEKGLVSSNGNVQLRDSGGRLEATLVPASGLGTKTWAQIEAKLASQNRLTRATNVEKWILVGCGVRRSTKIMAPPPTLIPGRDNQSILEASSSYDGMVDLEDLLDDPQLLTEILSQ